MEEGTKATGWTIICTAREFILGKMAGNMMEATKWTRNMVMVFIFGLMEESTRVSGKMVDNMERANTLVQIRK